MLFAAGLRGAAPREPEAVPFRALRAKDELTLSVGTGFLTFNQTIVLSPLGVKRTLEPGRPNVVHVLIPPLWLRDAGIDRPAFRTLRPYYNSSHGRVRRFAVMKPDGEKVLSTDQLSPDCRYVLSLEFGHVIPERFTVTIGFSSSSGINPEAEFVYTPSNDGQPVVSGAPETVLTNLRINAEAPLQPWKVLHGDAELPKITPYVVQLQREASHVIRFGGH